MKLKVEINAETGEMTLLDSKGKPVEGVVAVTQHTDPMNPDRPAWLTVSFRGGSYAIDVK